MCESQLQDKETHFPVIQVAHLVSLHFILASSSGSLNNPQRQKQPLMFLSISRSTSAKQNQDLSGRVSCRVFTVPRYHTTRYYLFIFVESLKKNKNVKVLVAQSCPTLPNPVDFRLPSSSVHGILQARILEWVVSILVDSQEFAKLLRPQLFKSSLENKKEIVN